MSPTARTITKKILYNKEAYTITDASRIKKIFKKIVQQKKYLSIVLNNTKSEFVSCILDADFDNESITFDALHPTIGNNKFYKAKRAYLLSSLDGIDILIPIKPRNTTSLSASGEDEIYSATFPEKIYQYQRRSHYRVNTYKSNLVNIVLDTTNNHELFAKTKNLSTGGIAVRIKKDSIVAKNDILNNCKLCLNYLIVAEVDAKVTFIDDTGFDNELTVGLEFINVTKDTTNTIDGIVRKAERQKLRELAKAENKLEISVYG